MKGGEKNMPIAYDVKNLAQDIEVSYGERMAYLSDLFRGTDNTLKTFHHNHQKMATDLWDFLTADRESREKLVEALRRKNKKEIAREAEDLANFLKESQRIMKKESDVLSSQIRDYLRSMEKEISSLLANFKAERQAMSHQMKEELSSFQKELEKTVREMRAPVIRDLKEAKDNWQTLAKIMAVKRAGKVVTPAKKIGEVPPKEVAKAAEAFRAGKAKEQIMRLISQSGNGLTLPQMGKALRVPYIRLAAPINELVKEGRVKKEDSQYFRA